MIKEIQALIIGQLGGAGAKQNTRELIYVNTQRRQDALINSTQIKNNQFM